MGYSKREKDTTWPQEIHVKPVNVGLVMVTDFSGSGLEQCAPPAHGIAITGTSPSNDGFFFLVRASIAQVGICGEAGGSSGE